MHTVGRHLLLELYDCDAAALDSVERVRAAVREATAISGATIVGEVYHHFDPQGMSGSILIAESHVSLHTWPESGYAAADYYTCGGIDPRTGMEHLAKELGAGSYRLVEVVRGLDEDVARVDIPPDGHRIADLVK